MKAWKELFRSHILERGLNYYEMGLVYDLKATDVGVKAIVEGTEDYHVKIEMRDERVFDMHCDCPYADDGNYCKHMAAVLYEIENDKPDKVMHGDSIQQIKEAKNELEEVIDKMPTEEVKKILLSLAWNDEALRNRIMVQYAPITPRQIVRLKKQIDAIAYKNADRGGFINYYNASDYIDELNKFMDDCIPQLIEKGHHMDAFEIVNHVFHEIGNRDMDDSDGGTTYVADNCYEYWRQILAACTEEEEKELFQWFTEHRENYVIDFMENYIEDFLVDEFQDEELLREKMRALDQVISQAEAEGESGSHYSSYYGWVSNVLERIQIMEKLRYSKSEILEYRNKYRKFGEIRRLEIAQFMEAKDYENAIRVLLESKSLDKEYPGLVSDYSLKLIEIYKRTNRQAEYKQELLDYVFEGIGSDIKYIMELKSICEEEEWIRYREQLLTEKLSYQTRLELLEKEGLYKRLLEEVQACEFVYPLDKYEKILKKHFPEDVRDTYIKYVKMGMYRASSRKVYKELAGYLKKIAKYPEGKKMAQEVADEWRWEYKRRSAMMEELSRAGF